MGTRTRVLVVDDDDAFRGAVVRMLRTSFDVVTATNGEEAVSTIASDGGLHVVVMDLEMPRMNGHDAYLQIAEVAPAVARRTLIMTGGTDVLALQEWLQELGPTRLLLKPFSGSRLFEAIGDLLAENPPTDDAA